MFPIVITNIITNLLVNLSAIGNYRYSRYHGNNCKMFGCHLICRYNFVVHKDVVMWNKVPSVLKSITSVNIFKTNLKSLVKYIIFA